MTAENISKSSKSNSKKNPTYANFGHLNQSQSLSDFLSKTGTYTRTDSLTESHIFHDMKLVRVEGRLDMTLE